MSERSRETTLADSPPHRFVGGSSRLDGDAGCTSATGWIPVETEAWSRASWA